MTTATVNTERTGGIFDVTPGPVAEAIRRYLDARDTCLADESSYYEHKRLGDVAREAKDACEAAILEHQGCYFLSGLYRVDGALVGMRKVDKGPLKLVAYPADSTKKGLRS